MIQLLVVLNEGWSDKGVQDLMNRIGKLVEVKRVYRIQDSFKEAIPVK